MKSTVRLKSNSIPDLQNQKFKRHLFLIETIKFL